MSYTILGMTMEEIVYLIKWAGDNTDITASDVFFDAMGHSTKGAGALDELYRLQLLWLERGGSFPIDERSRVFGPKEPALAALKTA